MTCTCGASRITGSAHSRVAPRGAVAQRAGKSPASCARAHAAAAAANPSPRGGALPRSLARARRQRTRRYALMRKQPLRMRTHRRRELRRVRRRIGEEHHQAPWCEPWLFVRRSPRGPTVLVLVRGNQCARVHIKTRRDNNIAKEVNPRPCRARSQRLARHPRYVRTRRSTFRSWFRCWHRCASKAPSRPVDVQVSLHQPAADLRTTRRRQHAAAANEPNLAPHARPQNSHARGTQGTKRQVECRPLSDTTRLGGALLMRLDDRVLDFCEPFELAALLECSVA